MILLINGWILMIAGGLTFALLLTSNNVPKNVINIALVIIAVLLLVISGVLLGSILFGRS